MVELGMDRGAQHRVAEEAGRHRLQVAVALLAHRVRRLVEEEELVFERRQDREAHLGGLGEHAAQEPARADRLGLARRARTGRTACRSRTACTRPVSRQDAHRRVGIGGVPAGVVDVVVELVVRIPADDHVAEAEALLERGEELVAADVFAAQDAVDVGDADLDMRVAALLDEATRILGAREADCWLCRHDAPSGSIADAARSRRPSFRGSAICHKTSRRKLTPGTPGGLPGRLRLRTVMSPHAASRTDGPPDRRPPPRRDPEADCRDRHRQRRGAGEGLRRLARDDPARPQGARRARPARRRPWRRGAARDVEAAFDQRSHENVEGKAAIGRAAAGPRRGRHGGAARFGHHHARGRPRARCASAISPSAPTAWRTRSFSAGSPARASTCSAARSTRPRRRRSAST